MRHFLQLRVLLLTLLSILGICTAGFTQTIRYVKPGGAGNGTSWDDASGNLQAMIDASAANGQVWVAAGTYKPTSGTDRNISFVMKNGVAIYGGFNGTETQLSQRNWVANVTTLSGEIGAADIGDNTLRVINNNFNAGAPLTSSAVLDGFTVEAGNANGAFPLNLGGGMWNAHASPTVRNCIFKNNAAVAGAGMFNDNSEASVTNCLFIANSCSVAGAAMSNGGGTASARVTNCTFFGNTGGNSTISNEVNATAITNCIVWGNVNGISGGTVTYSIVQGGFNGTGNLNADPLFVNTAGGDFRLQQCSPAVDAGTNTNAPTTDFDGNVRPFNATGFSNTDMGAYEYQSTYNVCTACLNITGGIVYVNASAAGSNNGSTWANAFTDLQSALTLARTYPTCVSQIWVAAGTYKPTTGTDRNISFAMVNGVAIYGGFNGTETQLSQRNWTANVTTLSGDIGTVGVNTDNSLRIFNNTSLNSNAILNGFVVRDAFNTSGLSGNEGGGMRNINSSPTIENCIFRNNNMNDNGGGIANLASSPVFANCLFFNNSGRNGGAIYTQEGSPTLINCTFANNTGNLGSAISGNYPNTNHTLSNCIVYGNNGSQPIFNNQGANSTVTYSIVQGGYPGTGNLDVDPLYVNAAGGDFRLQQCSPAIDAGTNTNAPTTDYDGNVRPFNATGVSNADMGAYEYQSTYNFCAVCAGTAGEIVYVNASAAGSNDGSTWANAFTDLQSALTLARTYPTCVSQIWVAAGTYKPTSGTDRRIAFSMVKGVAIYGGFPNSGNPTMTNRNWATNPTILSGDIGIPENDSDNSYRVFNNSNNGLTPTNALLDGFTITGGRALERDGDNYFGAGMSNNNTSPSLKNIVFLDNRAFIAGGMDNTYSAPSLSNVSFIGNRATGSGGGMSIFGANAVLVNVAFVGNQAADGAGFFINLSSPILTNISFVGNVATRGGALFLANSSRPILTNVTLSGNQANTGGAMYNITSYPTFNNSIIWGNASEIYNDEYGVPIYKHSLVAGLLPSGEGNLDGTLATNNPLFIKQPLVGLSTIGSDWNLNLQACSPAINVGNDGVNNINVDLAGNQRKIGIIDLGAYEYQGTAVAQPTASATTSTPSICSGTTINFSASGGSNFSWNGPAGSNFSSTEQNPSFNGSSTTYSGIYSVSVSNPNCSLTATSTVSLQVNPLPNATASSNSPVCVGGTLELSVSGGSSWTWSGPNFSSGAQRPSRVNATTAMSGRYSVTVSDGTCTISTTTSVTVNAPPVATASSNSPVCVGGVLNLSATGGSTYSWVGPSNFVSTAQNPTRSNAATNMTGLYTVTVSNGSCTNTATTSVVVSSRQTPSITSLRVNGQLPNARNVVTVAAGQAINFSVTASNAVMYSWQSSSGFSSTLQNPSISSATLANQGQYVVVARNGCQFFATRSVIVSIGSAPSRLASAEDAEPIDMEINAYPNPVSKTLTVEVRLKEPAALRLKLFNSIGQESGTWQLGEVRDFHRTELNLADLQGGVYLLEAAAGKQRAVKRVVKIQY